MRYTNRATRITVVTLTAIALVVGAACSSSSSGSQRPSTTITTSTVASPETTAAASAFCADLNTAMNGITALGSGAGTPNKEAAASLFEQLATYLESLAPDAPDNLGPALANIAASFRKASTVLGQQGGAPQDVFADPAYVAAAEQFVKYYTTECQPSLAT